MARTLPISAERPDATRKAAGQLSRWPTLRQWPCRRQPPSRWPPSAVAVIPIAHAVAGTGQRAGPTAPD